MKVNLTAQKRGDIEIKITSPAGTTSTLLAVRPMDNSRSGFANWPFMTVHDWGEQPNGYWELTVINHGRNCMFYFGISTQSLNNKQNRYFLS